jgi:hypothetical protein
MKESSVFTFNLVSNTGYEAEGEYPRVSPAQYGQVIAALEGTLMNVSPAKELLNALQMIADGHGCPAALAADAIAKATETA